MLRRKVINYWFKSKVPEGQRVVYEGHESLDLLYPHCGENISIDSLVLTRLLISLHKILSLPAKQCQTMD